jgi:hypothetical protein
MVAGGTLEAVGIGLIAWQIRRDRSRADRLLRRPHTILVGSIRSESAVGTPTVTGGREPTPEQRLDHLEHQVRVLQDDLGEAQRELRSELRADVEGAESRVASRLEEAASERRDVLVDILAGSLRERRIGVGVLLLGVALATAANVWSLFVSC